MPPALARSTSIPALLTSAVLAFSVLPLGGAQAQPAPAQRADRSVTITDGPGGSSLTVTSSRRGKTPSGRRGFVGLIAGEIVDPEDPQTNHGPTVDIYFDIDGDDRPELLVRESSPSGYLDLYSNESWTVDPQGADLTYAQCVERLSGAGFRMRYDPDCLGAHGSMRIAAVVYGGAEPDPIGAARTWSDRVLTPSKPVKYCRRSFGPVAEGQRDVLLASTQVAKMTCTRGTKMLRRAARVFRKRDKRALVLGSFRCTDKNGMGTPIICRHKQTPSRFAVSYFLP